MNETASVLPGEVPASRRLSRILAIAAVLFAAAAVSTRFVDLSGRPFHHDESIHAHQSYTLARDGTWRYDPAYHGPFLYYANALVYKLAGASDTTARVLPALFGLVLIAFAWPLARWIGRGAAAAFAIFALISPHLTYFSRFIREDIYSLVFTLGTIMAFRFYLDSGRSRWLMLSAVSFALAGVTKENAYMTGVLFVAFGLWTFAERAVRERPRAAALRNALAAAGGWIRPRLGPLVAAGLIFLLIWTGMYTAFGKYPGDWFAIPKAVGYWMGQHAIARIPGPWYYYFPLLAFYETAALLAAAFAFPPRAWRHDPFLRFVWLASLGLLLLGLLFFAAAHFAIPLPGPPIGWAAVITLAAAAAALLAFPTREIVASPFVRFVAFWAVGSVALYTWAREKVPWLTVHSLLPILILASVGVARLWEDRHRKGARLGLAAIFLLASVNASGMLLACFRYSAHDKERDPKHAEMLAYVQTSKELIRALEAVPRARQRLPPEEPPIAVAGEAGWPLTWYLRDTPTKWGSRIEEVSTPILVADWEADGKLAKQLSERYDAKTVPIRSWWFPELLQKTSKPRPGLRQLARWWLFHEIWSPIGSQDAVFLTRKDLAGSGPLPPLKIPVEDRSAREYPNDASPLEPQRSWGEAGTGPGQFAEPRGLAADARGNLYVADSKNGRIQVFGIQGEFLREFGTKGTGDGQLNDPCGLAVDLGGEVWVADTWNHRVVRFGPNGEFRAAFGDPEKTLFGPRAILLSREWVYVADTGNKRIVRFDRDGKRVSEWGGEGSGPGQFIEPVGLAADASGSVFVADTGNHRVQVFDPEGKFLREFPVFGWTDFYTEPYLVVEPSGGVVVTDASTGRVARYDASGALRLSWQPPGTFKAPTGIAMDPLGRLTVTDRATHRLFSWALADVLR